MAQNEDILTPSHYELLDKLVSVYSKIEESKLLYKEFDTLSDQFMQVFGSKEISHNGKVIFVKDNFANKNVVFKPAAVRRLEIVVEDIDKR